MPKKITLCLTLLFVFSFAVPVSAANTGGNQGSGMNQGQSTPMSQPKTQTTTVVAPTGMQVKNQNQVQTQNAGEEQSLQVQTKEEEVSKNATSASNGRGRIQIEDTTKTMEAVLAVPMIPGGPGAKVQDVLTSQVASQKDIETQISKLDGRKGIVKMLLGADTSALQILQKQMEQNQLRIQELTQLKMQIANAGDVAMVEETIQMLTEQNTALQEKVAVESKSQGIAGWILRLFTR